MSIQSILKQIGTFITNLVAGVKKAIGSGVDVANEIKNAVNSPLADVIVNLTATNLDNEGLALLRSWIVILYKDLGLLQDTTDTFEEATAKASATIAQMQLPQARIGTLNTVAAAISTKVAEIKGEDLPMQTALAVIPSAYQHPELLS